MATVLNRHFSKRQINGHQRHERHPPSLAIREIQLKTTMNYHPTPGQSNELKVRCQARPGNVEEFHFSQRGPKEAGSV
jgi:hypothetical protein